MTDFVIGDVQGCFDQFQSLLKLIKFERGRDRVFLCGDLVNRGPKSLDMVMWMMDHPDCAFTVLGNHDVYLIARLMSLIPKKDDDTMGAVYECPWRQKILDWYLKQPVYRREDFGHLVHAGIWPEWTWENVSQRATQVHRILSSSSACDFLKTYFETRKSVSPPVGVANNFAEECWSLRVFVTIRNISGSSSKPEKGLKLTSFTGELSQLPVGEVPWFRFPSMRSPEKEELPIFFGHWAAVGFHRENAAVALDSGCVWGGKLTGVEADSLKIYSVPGLVEPTFS